MSIRASLMKVVVKIHDVVALAKRFQTSPTVALQELREHVRQGARQVLERVMDAEIEVFLGQDADTKNKRNGYTERSFVLKGIGSINLVCPVIVRDALRVRLYPVGGAMKKPWKKTWRCYTLQGFQHGRWRRSVRGSWESPCRLRKFRTRSKRLFLQQKLLWNAICPLVVSRHFGSMARTFISVAAP